MPLTQLAPPYPIFTDKNGDPLDAGYLYFGVADQNPETNPIQVYWDNSLTQPAAQPIRTINGYPSRNGSPAAVYTSDYFSVTVRNKKNELVIYAPSGYGVTPGTSASFTDQMVYNEGSTGAVDRVLTGRLQDSVSIKDFGAVGDGVTNDRDAIQNALNTGKSVYIPHGNFVFNSSISFTADNQQIFGDGPDCKLSSASGAVYITSNGFNDCGVRRITLDGSGNGGGTTNGGIRVNNGSRGFTVEGCVLYRGQQRVWLYTCSHVSVLNNTFNNTGYGVIQQLGFSSSNVLVKGNHAYDMISDFVEANGANIKSYFWTVADNIYAGSASYPAAGTEKRFAGFTEVEGVVITGNLVRQVAGDAPVHLEDLYGETIIADNIFDNCIVSGGNDGYIYLLNSGENTIINGNIFLRTDATLSNAVAVSVGSAAYSNTVQFTNNRVVGNGATGNFSGVNYSFQSGAAIVSNNIFENCGFGISSNQGDNMVVSDNIFLACNDPIINPRGASTTAGKNWIVSGNMFKDTVGTYDVFSRANTNGTFGPRTWKVYGNQFAATVLFGGDGPSGSSGEMQDVIVTDNHFKTGATFSFVGTRTRCFESGNTFADTGTRIGNYSTLLTDVLGVTGAIVKGYPDVGTGALTIRVTGLRALTGAVVERCILALMTGGTDAGGTGTYSRLALIALSGTTTYSAGVAADIVGTTTVTVSNQTSTSVDITVTSSTSDSNSAFVALAANSSGARLG